MTAIPLRERTVGRMFARGLAAGPERPFLVTTDAEVSWAEAEDVVARLAGGLAVHGVGAGTRVALLLDNGPHYVWLLLALARLGAVAVTLNGEAKGALLTYYLSDAQPALGIADEAHASELALAAAAAGVPARTLRAGDEGWLDRLAGDARPVAAEELPAFSDPFAVLYTSGTTGMPKGVPVSHAHAVTCGAIFVEQLGLGPDDRLYTCLPLFHINATAYTLCGALVASASIALGPRFSARRFWADVAATGATEINGMGSMLKILQARDPEPAERAHAARTMFVAPLPDDAAALGERFGLRFATTYAQTEWLPSSMTRPGEGYGRPGATGPVLPSSEVQIVGEDDVALAPGTRGEIALRAHEPHVTFPGYLGRPEASLAAFRNLRFHTGDVGEIDGDGWLLFHGRAGDVIRRRGENISPTVIESILATHEAVAEVAAVPVPSTVMEHEVFAWVVLREGAELSPAAFERFAREALPRYMVPCFAAFVDDLPRTATNKVARQALRTSAEQAVADGLAPLAADGRR